MGVRGCLDGPGCPGRLRFGHHDRAGPPAGAARGSRQHGCRGAFGIGGTGRYGTGVSAHVDGRRGALPYQLWGAVERSFNGGSTWTGVTEPEASNLTGVSCAAGTSDCIAVGQSEGATGMILRTLDDGSTWTEMPLP
jgi:hypothetical protein